MSSKDPFIDQYFNVLLNIEMGIVEIYKEYPELTDHQVDKVLNGLIRTYTAELKGRSAPKLRFTDAETSLFERVEFACGMFIGENVLVDDDTGEELPMLEPKTVEEIIACLKRIRKSVKFWTKEHGRQGYLNYVKQFLSAGETDGNEADN